MAAPQRVLQFESKALPEDTLLVTRVTGDDEISSPYRYEVELVSQKVDIDFTKVLGSGAYLGIKKGVTLTGGGERAFQLLRIHGMLSSFRQEEMQDKGWVRYRAVLVPRFWALSLTVRSRVFLDKSVKEIVEAVLKEAGFAAADFEFRLTATSPSREYVVQYQESDLDFLARWLEHEGICYIFEQTEDHEKVVFVDAMAKYQPIAGDAQLGYRPGEAPVARVEGGGAQDWFQKEVVHSWAAEQNVIPAEVVLKDYNWRKPSLDLRVTAKVSKDGVGHVYESGSHYKDKSEGEALAKVRAEEISCRKLVFRGQSDCRALRAGAKFTLADHFRKDFNAEVLIVSVRHEAGQKLGQDSTAGTGAVYRNEFTAIPAAATFRPERKTLWPSIHGVVNATIDGGGDSKYAEIDDEGRYKVKLAFDLSDKKDGKASRYIRMAQPYSGAGMGMHFPLHKGTEVLLTFVDGDPDRPIIASSVPNPETGSPVKGGNSSQCAIQTGGGNKIVIEDSDGGQRIAFSSPTAGTFFSIGAPPA